MAISEACKYEIEESVDKACEEKGIPKAEAFTALQTFYNGIGVPITFGAIKTKYYRAHKEVSNETPPPTPSNNTEKEDGMMEDEKDILCNNCKKNIAERIKRKGEWYYYPHLLCRGCRNEGDGKPRTKKKKNLEDELERAVQKAEAVNKTGNVTYLGTFIITHLKSVPISDPGRIGQFRKVFCWIKNIFEMEGIEHGC